MRTHRDNRYFQTDFANFRSRETCDRTAPRGWMWNAGLLYGPRRRFPPGHTRHSKFKGGDCGLQFAISFRIIRSYPDFGLSRPFLRQSPRALDLSSRLRTPRDRRQRCVVIQRRRRPRGGKLHLNLFFFKQNPFCVAGFLLCRNRREEVLVRDLDGSC